jgi:hypothetical protein
VIGVGAVLLAGVLYVATTFDARTAERARRAADRTGRR